MRIFKCRPFGDFDVDLDDPKTYEYLPDTTKELRQIMLSEIGYSHCYLNYWHKDDGFGNRKTNGNQIRRIESLIKNFTENERDNYNNVMWYKEQIFLFQDEIENMC
jgi:hypothetical protein